MNQYLLDTKYAAENLVEIMQREKGRLADKLVSYRMMKGAEETLFNRMKSDKFTPEGLIDLYSFNVAAERFSQEANQIAISITSLEDSMGILAGALLQIAKQGISICYGSLTSCPNGRVLDKEFVKNIIWQGRNQAMHFDEGKYSPKVVDCFKHLELSFGPIFKLRDKNLAYDVITLLGWSSYNSYEGDMMQLLT